METKSNLFIQHVPKNKFFFFNKIYSILLNLTKVNFVVLCVEKIA